MAHFKHKVQEFLLENPGQTEYVIRTKTGFSPTATDSGVRYHQNAEFTKMLDEQFPYVDRGLNFKVRLYYPYHGI